MMAALGNGRLDHHRFATGDELRVTVRVLRQPDAAQPVDFVGRESVVHVNVSVPLILRIERDALQAAFLISLRVQLDKGTRQRRTVFVEYEDRAVFFPDEQHAVRRKRQYGRVRKAGVNLLNVKPIRLRPNRRKLANFPESDFRTCQYYEANNSMSGAMKDEHGWPKAVSVTERGLRMEWEQRKNGCIFTGRIFPESRHNSATA